MKSRCFFLALLGCLAIGHAEEEELPPLPRWSEEDAARLLQGEELITDALFQLSPEDELAAPALGVLELPDLGPDNLELIDPTQIAEEDLTKFFGQKPKSYLSDPQNLLTRQEYRDRLSFLKYHASDSKVGFYVYVFDEKQIIPPIVRAEELFSRYFADDGPTVLLFYFMGNPKRSEIHLSADLVRSVGKSERNRALQSSINQAVVKSQSVDQLDGFCVQMSIRIYWMEKALEAGLIAPIEEDKPTKVVNQNAEKIAALHLWWMSWRIPLGVGFVVVLVGSVFTWWRRRRMTYVFPEFDVAPRLGGQHGAGIGAVISYSSARIPAAMQREQVPDYSRR